MTTGALKLASLLMVIAAGGGVAWQVQQGILHPQSAETADTDETVDSESDETSDSTADPFADVETGEDSKAKISKRSSPKKSTAGWQSDDESESQPSTVSPSKYQRPPRNKGPELEAAIPARMPIEVQPNEPKQSAADSIELIAAESAASGPFAEDAAPVAKPTPKLRTFAPLPELIPATDVAAAVADESSAPPTLETDASDPFNESEGVMLVGNDEPEPSLDSESAVAEESETADDPFAGAAPPEDVEETAPLKSEKTLKRNRTRADEPTSGPAASPQDNDGVDEIPPAGRRRGMPTELSDLPAKLDVPTDAPDDSDSFDSETSVPSLDVSERSESKPRRDSRRSSPAGKEAPAEPAPRLLPVPDAAPAKSSPREPTRQTAPERNGPEFGDFGPSDDPLEEEELRGDGTPDSDAPQGLQQPRLTIEKIAPKQAVVGQPLIYSVVVKNVGSANAHQVTVEDRIPKGTKLEGTSPRAELIDKRLVWKLGVLKPDEQKKILIKLIPQEQGPIGSVAKVNFVAEIAAEIQVTAPQILVSVNGPSQVRLGDKLQLVFKVRNAGGADAQNVIVRNQIPDGLRHPAGADLEYAIGTLPSQESREIKLDLIAMKNGKVLNKTVITADAGVTVEEETPIEVIGEQLLLTRTGKNRLFVDKPAVFTSTVANDGTASATKVMVAEVVPAGMEFVSASDNGKYDPVTRAVTWSIGPIDPGQEMKLTTKLMPKTLGDYRATVTVTGPAGSVATVDAELKIDGFAAVAVESKTNARLISVGEKATIRIACKNQGTAAAKNLILTAELPPELKLVDGNGPSAWARQGNRITFEAVAHLDPNETATFDVQVEGVNEGDTRIELQISADHLTRPLHRDETIRVAPETE